MMMIVIPTNWLSCQSRDDDDDDYDYDDDHNIYSHARYSWVLTKHNQLMSMHELISDYD